MAKRPQGYGVNGSVNYVMVDSVETSVDKAQKLGGRPSSKPISRRSSLRLGIGRFAIAPAPACQTETRAMPPSLHGTAA